VDYRSEASVPQGREYPRIQEARGERPRPMTLHRPCSEDEGAGGYSLGPSRSEHGTCLVTRQTGGTARREGTGKCGRTEAGA
jgi:hypothetical protein